MDRRLAIAWLGCVLAAAPAAAQSVAAVQALSFGRIVANSGGNVTVDPAGGRSRTGGVVLVMSGPGAAARFQVTGTASASYSIGLPLTPVTLSSGANSMAVGSFNSTPAGAGQLGLGGTQWVNVGAVLTVANGQPAGAYAGTFSITVNYN